MRKGRREGKGWAGVGLILDSGMTVMRLVVGFVVGGDLWKGADGCISHEIPRERGIHDITSAS